MILPPHAWNEDLLHTIAENTWDLQSKNLDLGSYILTTWVYFNFLPLWASHSHIENAEDNHTDFTGLFLRSKELKYKHGVKDADNKFRMSTTPSFSSSVF